MLETYVVLFFLPFIFVRQQQIAAIELDELGAVSAVDTLTDIDGNNFDLSNPLDVAVDPVTGAVFVASFSSGGLGANGELFRLAPTVAVVPEPSSLIPIAMGGCLLTLRRRRNA